MKSTTCSVCGGPAEMIDEAPPGESGDVVRCERQCVEVDDGVEIELKLTVKVKRYIPSAGRGRLCMYAAGAEWSEKKLHGHICMPDGGASPVVGISDDPESPGELYTFDAQSMIKAVVAVFRADKRKK